MIAAHLIVGARKEPFLTALLESIRGVADVLIVNDNSGDPHLHQEILEHSWFGRNHALLLDRSAFVDFSTARNHCLRLHGQHRAGEWIVFIDSDEVHGERAKQIASRLAQMPDEIDFVDGYTWHFFQSFDYYTSIERRMMFFRFRPSVRWEGSVHEQLQGLSGSRLVLPYVYGHYGHVLPARRHAEKELFYRSFGHEVYRDSDSTSLPRTEEELNKIDAGEYFQEKWPLLLPFKGMHPPAAREVIADLRKCYALDQARAAELVEAVQTPMIRLRNKIAKLNYEQRWRSRILNPLARKLLAS